MALITFDLLMKTASFETDSKRAEKRLRELKKEAADFGVALGAAAAGGLAALTYALKQSIDEMDRLGEASQSVGITTEALSQLSYVAQMSGSSAEELEKGLVKLAVAAANGDDAFSAMGISTTDAAGNLKKTDELLLEVSDKFAGYADGAEKSALAVDLFGKSGAALIPLLNSGSDGIRELAAEADALGLTVTDSAAASAGSFNDVLDKMQFAVAGVTRGLAAEMLPSMVALGEEIVNTTKESGALDGAVRVLATGFRLLASGVVIVGSVFKTTGDFLGNLFGLIVGTAIDAVRTVADAFTSIGDALTSVMRGDFAGAGAALQAAGDGAVGYLSRTVDRAGLVVDGLVGDVAGAASAVGAIWETEAKKAEAVAQASPAGGIAAPIVAAEKAATAAAAGIGDAAKDALEAQKALIAEGERLAESVATPLEQRDAKTSRINELAAVGVIDPETQRRALEQVANEYDEFVKSQSASVLSNYGDLLDEQERMLIEYNARREQIETDALLSSEQREEYLFELRRQYNEKLDEEQAARDAEREEAIARQLEMVAAGFANSSEIAKAFLGEQSSVYQALFAVSKSFALADLAVNQAKAIGKAWGENNYFVAAGLSIALAGQFAGLVASVEGANFGGALAAGGPASPDRAYLVGERGPEMFVPDSAGRVIPSDVLAAPAAPPVVNVRNINAFDDNHIADYLRSSSGDIVILNSMIRNKTRAGFK